MRTLRRKKGGNRMTACGRVIEIFIHPNQNDNNDSQIRNCNIIVELQNKRPKSARSALLENNTLRNDARCKQSFAQGLLKPSYFMTTLEGKHILYVLFISYKSIHRKLKASQFIVICIEIISEQTLESIHHQR